MRKKIARAKKFREGGSVSQGLRSPRAARARDDALEDQHDSKRKRAVVDDAGDKGDSVIQEPNDPSTYRRWGREPISHGLQSPHARRNRSVGGVFGDDAEPLGEEYGPEAPMVRRIVRQRSLPTPPIPPRRRMKAGGKVSMKGKK